MKKSILFVIDSLHCAGAEKSLTTLLSLIDYSIYSVDLQLFARGGLFEQFIPKEVHILEPPKYMKFAQLSLMKALIYSVKNHSFNMLNSRIKFSLQLRLSKYDNSQKARVFWQSVSNVIEPNTKIYDAAVSYSQEFPTFYVADKVYAKAKFAWVNSNYRLGKKELEFQKNFYEKFDKIIAVSASVKQSLLDTFPDYVNKVEVIHDIINPDLVVKMADAQEPDDMKYDGIKLLTIGRLTEIKGYDIMLGACKKLKDKGTDFKWYIIGIGPLERKIVKFVWENKLSDKIILLGTKHNPYPYIKNSYIYVQTSRSEGFGLAIAEARILNIPVVTTRFEGVYNQMKDSKNGLVVDINPDAVSEGITKLIYDKELRTNIIKYLRTEKKGNSEEISKVYKLF